MMTAAAMKKTAIRHALWCAGVYLLAAPVVFAVLHVAIGIPSAAALTPLVVAVIVALVEMGVVLPLWCHCAAQNSDRLPTFYSAAAGMRFLVVLAVLFGVYLVVGRSNMLPFVVALLLYYLLILVMHSFFFARANDKLFVAHSE